MFSGEHRVLETNLPIRVVRKMAATSVAMLVALSLVGGIPLLSADLAVMRNGFSIRHQRREVRKDLTRLYLGDSADNYVDVPSAEIVRVEGEDAPPPRDAQLPVTDPKAEPAMTLDQAILSSSRRYHLDPDFIRSLIRTESAFNAHAVSAKGAVGLMQLMPHTAAEMGVSDALDPVANVEGGTRYIAGLLSLYNNNSLLALAAYNAGPRRIDQYRGVPPYKETREYVAKVLADFSRTKAEERKAGAQSSRATNLGNTSGGAKTDSAASISTPTQYQPARMHP